jgi:Na+-transporting methylmalonyl-CoA/oxaloacetate decarboxylase gamma subunit
VSSDSTAATTAATASSGGASSGEQANGAIANQAARTDDMISTSADAFDLAYPLIGAGVGLVVLLLLIALVVVLVRRKKKQRSPHDKQSPDKQPVVPASAPEMGTSTVGTTMYGNVAAVAPSRNIKVGSYQAVSVVSDNTTYSPLDLEKSGTAYMPMEMGGKQTDIGSHY